MSKVKQWAENEAEKKVDNIIFELNDVQIANIKKLWSTKKPSDVTPAIRKMIKGAFYVYC